ncbi:MAG: hypothetical protein D6711_09445 [Chloroflexi bacterium]|nr:MAG: hypothetical protein D6711_09445 [Chloroflexota bacterium]
MHNLNRATTSNTSTLVSLAILKTNYENNRDFLEIFVPIVAEAIRISNEEIVTAGNVQKDVEQQFGLTIPQNTLKTILIRVKKRGYLRQENRILYKNAEKLADLESSFKQVQLNVVRMYEDLIKEFLRYCDTQLDIEFNESEADNAFQIYLRENEVRNYQETVIPERRLSKLSTRSVIYFVGMFIKHLEETHSSHFASWTTISTGNMLANSVYLADPAQPNRRFKNTSIYFDTSFLIYALGYAGEPRQAPCTELLELLYEVGADLKVFRHTIEEIRGILAACENRIAQGQLSTAYGDTLEYFISKRYSATDIALLSVQLERDLGSLRITVEEKPDYSIHSYVIDEDGLKLSLNSRIPYRDPDGSAIYHDIDSISAIVRLRRGKAETFVEYSRALFVTSNSDLAQASKDFFLSEKHPRAVPPCVTDYDLTTKIWLKKAHSAPNLPRKRIIADYYAAIQPDNGLLKQYYEEIEKLREGRKITREDYYLLRYSLESKAGLMEATRGGEDAITDVTIGEALTYIKDNMIAEEQNRTQEIASERDAARTEAESLQAAENERKARIKSRSQRWASFVMRWVKWIVLVLLAITTLTTFPWDLPPIESNILQYILIFLQIALLITGIINAMFGTPIETYLRKAEISLSHRIERFLTQLSS